MVLMFGQSCFMCHSRRRLVQNVAHDVYSLVRRIVPLTVVLGSSARIISLMLFFIWLLPSGPVGLGYLFPQMIWVLGSLFG